MNYNKILLVIPKKKNSTELECSKLNQLEESSRNSLEVCNK